MQFYFIRHAQSANNALWDRTGSSRGRSHDPEITALGRQQACALADYLQTGGLDSNGNEAGRVNQNGYGFTHLYTSLMLRAVQTGSIVAEQLDLPLDVWVDAHEAGGMYLENEDTGEINGMPGVNRNFLREKYPLVRLPDVSFDQGWWSGGLESREESRVRAQRFLKDLIDRHGNTDDRVALISHGAFYNLLLKAILQMPVDADVWFLVNNAAITRVDFGEEIGVAYMNRTCFLKPDLIT